MRTALFSCVLILSLLTGCADDATLIAQAQTTATSLVQNTAATRATLVAKLATLPATDPARANV
jgi:hypothetical protein